MENNKRKNQAVFKLGTVVSDRMNKTIVVAVTEFKTYPKYKKKYKLTKRYKVHNEKNKYKSGDVVKIVPTRMMSKSKFYKVL